MKNLHPFGWNDLRQEFVTSNHPGLQVGRVVSIKGFKYHIVNEKGVMETELSGKLLFENENDQLPKVGDWIVYIDYETIGYIVDLLPRTNALARKTPGKKTERQILAANIDGAIIIQGLDRDFNLMRLERYIVQIEACGIEPVIVLNKSDLVDAPSLYVEKIRKLQRNCRIFFCSTFSGNGIPELLREVFLPGKTFVLIGSSGVGKSSLLNTLLRTEVQSTGPLSGFNKKGKHTTTTRDLFMLPNGALIIDTPGMREFGLTSEIDSSETDAFPIIEKLSAGCQFSDCTHINEKGCSVLSALENGTLDHLIYDSFIKLIKEQRRFQISADQKKQLAKQFGKMTKEAKNHRKKYKY
jgi:ribosome biogenesis GTPase / thiamine phosphate phosphatase